MTHSEYLAWRAETKMQIRMEHPTWQESQVIAYCDKVEKILFEKGLITYEF